MRIQNCIQNNSYKQHKRENISLKLGDKKKTKTNNFFSKRNNKNHEIAIAVLQHYLCTTKPLSTTKTMYMEIKRT